MKRGRKPSLIKSCPKCGDTNKDNFGPNKRRSDGLQVWCKSCASKHFSSNAYRYSLKYNYGLSEEDYRNLLQKQKGVCALCNLPFSGTKGQSPNSPVVDHDHVTGQIRGIIHHSCNHMLGHAYDNPKILAAGIAYLTTQTIKQMDYQPHN